MKTSCIVKLTLVGLGAYLLFSYLNKSKSALPPPGTNPAVDNGFDDFIEIQPERMNGFGRARMNGIPKKSGHVIV
ncbi:MAG TPA: hypothetical protein PLS73_10755 [Saprospiraceae bacterium]|nr:hypothetical protein [Saprospiraceae bacterium]